jgi:hypothetical protein
MTKRAIAVFVIAVLAGGCAQGNSDEANAINMVIAAPVVIPAVLVVCAAGGCKKTKAEKEAQGELYHQLSVETRAEKEKERQKEQEQDPATRAAAAQFELGVTDEVNGHFIAAALWYRKSAEQGYAKAQARLAVLYEIGTGVEKDYVQADTWYSIALLNRI